MLRLKEGTYEPGSDASAPGQRSAAEKLQILLASKLVPEEHFGQWLGEQGLHSEHLPLWEQEMTQIVTDKADTAKATIAQLVKENKRLHKELTRKEKALAEMAALMVLKKKRTSTGGAAKTADRCRGPAIGNRACP